MTLNRAQKMIEASETKAKELGIAITTAVVDEHGTLVALSKMDGALLVSPQFAQSKAFTSAHLGVATSGLAECHFCLPNFVLPANQPFVCGFWIGLDVQKLGRAMDRHASVDGDYTLHQWVGVLCGCGLTDRVRNRNHPLQE